MFRSLPLLAVIAAAVTAAATVSLSACAAGYDAQAQPDSGDTETTYNYGDAPAWAAEFSLKNPSAEAAEPVTGSPPVKFDGTLMDACKKYGGVKRLTADASANNIPYDIQSYKDSKHKTLYLFMPCTADLSSVTYYAVHDSGTTTGPYTSDFSSGSVQCAVSDKTFDVTAMQSGIPSLCIQIDESEGKISKMNSSSDHTAMCYGEMTLVVTDSLAAERGWQTKYVSVDKKPESPCSLEMRGRGNWTWNQEKKPYQIKCENKLDLLGMGAAKTWILLANVMDASLLRDQLFFDLAADMGLAGSPDIEPVDVFLNGEYLGSYSLCEKVEADPQRVDIDETRDFLLEIDHYYMNETYTFVTDRGRPFTLHNREDFESVAIIKEIINGIEEEIYDKSSNGYSKYLDMDSWIKYYWIQELSRNNDTMIGSCFMYYVMDEQKLYAGPIWDMDNTLGIWGSGINLKREGWHARLFKWFDALIKHSDFKEAADKYYTEGGLRELFASLPGRIDEYAAYVKDSAEMNYIVNDKNHYVPLDTVTYDDEVEYLKEFLSDRLKFYEKEYGFID
jgi:hypothetical protein